jgi:hypothetical protein
MISLTREQYLDSIQQLRDRAASYGSELTASQLTWQPQGGARWSVLECLDHMVVFNGQYLPAVETAAAGAPSGGRAGEFRTAGFPSQKFLSFTEPPPKTKVKAPGKIAPRPTLNPEKIIPDFLNSLERISGFVRSTSGKDLNAVRFTNPFIPILRFTVGSGLLVLAAHTRRHMYQADQILKDPEFP